MWHINFVTLAERLRRPGKWGLPEILHLCSCSLTIYIHLYNLWFLLVHRGWRTPQARGSSQSRLPDRIADWPWGHYTVWFCRHFWWQWTACVIIQRAHFNYLLIVLTIPSWGVPSTANWWTLLSSWGLPSTTCWWTSPSLRPSSLLQGTQSSPTMHFTSKPV